MYDYVDGKAIMRKEYQEKEYQVSVKVSGIDIENILVAALEGEVNQWASLDLERKSPWGDKPQWLPPSRFATQTLIEGGTILLNDLKDPIVYYELTLQKLIRGIGDYLNSPSAVAGCAIPAADRLFEQPSGAMASEIVKTAVTGRR